MPTFLISEHLRFDFTLISLSEVYYKTFLNADNPQVRMLGILGSFGKEDNYQAVLSIVRSIQSNTNGDFAESRHFKQLRILVQLRNGIKQEFEKAMESVTTFFKEENDYLYRKGEAKGEAKGEQRKSHAIVENMILEPGVADEQAARIAGVSLDYVKNVRAEMENKDMIKGIR